MLLGAVIVAACSGTKSGDIAAPAAGDAGTADATLGVACEPSAESLRQTVFARSCSTAGCHAGADPAGALDLEKPGIEARVTGAAASECGAQTLVVPGNPDASYLFRKIADAKPTCGGRMPRGAAALSDAEIACVRTWIAKLVVVTDRDAGGAVDSGRDAGITCGAGLELCGSACVDTQTDPKNCGKCGNPCAVSCAAGACVSSCPPSTTNCSGACVDTTSNAAHCNGCGKPCPGGQLCVASTCTCGSTVSFGAQLQPILTSACATNGCHAGALPKASLPLGAGASYGSLVNAPSATCPGRIRVVPGAVAQSYLVNKLTGVDTCGGTQMPKAGGALPAAQIDLFRMWICNGAPNN